MLGKFDGYEHDSPSQQNHRTLTPDATHALIVNWELEGQVYYQQFDTMYQEINPYRNMSQEAIFA